MITGFTTSYGRVLRMRESCAVTDRGMRVDYGGSVDVVVGPGGSTMWTMWTYHAGDFRAQPTVGIPDSSHHVQAFVHSSTVDGTRSINIYTNPGLGGGQEVRIDLETEMFHPTPLEVFRRSSGEHGLELLELQVRFAESSVPQRIWRCWWEADGPQDRWRPILAEEEVLPELVDVSEDGARHYAVGFSWRNVPPHHTYGFGWEW